MCGPKIDPMRSFELYITWALLLLIAFTTVSLAQIVWRLYAEVRSLRRQIYDVKSWVE